MHPQLRWPLSAMVWRMVAASAHHQTRRCLLPPVRLPPAQRRGLQALLAALSAARRAVPAHRRTRPSNRLQKWRRSARRPVRRMAQAASQPVRRRAVRALARRLPARQPAAQGQQPPASRQPVRRPMAHLPLASHPPTPALPRRTRPPQPPPNHCAISIARQPPSPAGRPCYVPTTDSYLKPHHNRVLALLAGRRVISLAAADLFKSIALINLQRPRIRWPHLQQHRLHAQPA